MGRSDGDAGVTRDSDAADRGAPQTTGPQNVAVVIAARDDRSTIAATVRACRAIPRVDLIVVVDDGSDDDTGAVARMAGAAVVRHSVPRGRSSALETGVKVVAMRDRADWPARHILFLDPDLGDSAVEASVLVDAVLSGECDCALGVPEHFDPFQMRGPARSAARKLLVMTGWVSRDPLATNRCLTREALTKVMPFHVGSAVDLAMTMDLLTSGSRVRDFPCAFEHVPNESKPRGSVWQPSRSDAWVVLQTSRIKNIRALRRRLAKQD
ncbi:glycosyltransferase [Actinomycetaceae bacterium MB13-C1-2]|nr:glycosyltransferase [Actinomycetaceae bacterium MB13-C1-2]